MDASDILSNTVDKSQVPPLHQKRILAFVNHFLISSCTFLNEFATKCEEKFIEVERKMQKIEAALIIIEAKLSSIPNVENTACKPTDEKDSSGSMQSVNPTEEVAVAQDTTTTTTTENPNGDAAEAAEPTPIGIKACQDVRYIKFFKMVQFGVPADAVKMKMKAEGLDPSILDSPNLILDDGVSS